MDVEARIILFVTAAPLVLLAFALHEMAHAYTATWFGDPTPARHGRRTLNPIRHLDPIGTAMLCISLLLFGAPMGFAVTPVDDSKMRRPRLHGALVSLAGPVTNVLLCAVSIALIAALVPTLGPDSFRLSDRSAPFIYEALFYSMVFNAFLAVFNLLPIPPLDGGRIVGSLMDEDTRREWRKIDEYGIFIILGLILLGGASFTAFLDGLQARLIQVLCFVVDCSAIGLG